MEPVVEVVLTGDFCQFTPRATFKIRDFRSLKASERTASQSEASPQQAESLAAAVRTFTHNITQHKIESEATSDDH